jgi:hypothetical protein
MKAPRIQDSCHDAMRTAASVASPLQAIYHAESARRDLIVAKVCLCRDWGLP